MEELCHNNKNYYTGYASQPPLKNKPYHGPYSPAFNLKSISPFFFEPGQQML